MDTQETPELVHTDKGLGVEIFLLNPEEVKRDPEGANRHFRAHKGGFEWAFTLGPIPGLKVVERGFPRAISRGRGEPKPPAATREAMRHAVSNFIVEKQTLMAQAAAYARGDPTD